MRRGKKERKERVEARAFLAASEGGKEKKGRQVRYALCVTAITEGEEEGPLIGRLSSRKKKEKSSGRWRAAGPATKRAGSVGGV